MSEREEEMWRFDEEKTEFSEKNGVPFSLPLECSWKTLGSRRFGTINYIK